MQNFRYRLNRFLRTRSVVTQTLAPKHGKRVYIDEEIAKAMLDINDFNFDDNFLNQQWLEVIEKESGGRNGDLLSETLNGDGGNVVLALAESIVVEKSVG